MAVLKLYIGPLNNPNNMSDGPVKDAYVSWREQRTRCYNKNRDKYKHYGAKGIEVKYTSREFIGWWLENIKGFEGKSPTVSRIDHSGHYEFGNIQIDSRSANSSERNRRVAPFCSPRPVCAFDKNHRLLAVFKSINAAARFFKIKAGTVSNQVNGKSKKIGEMYFRPCEYSEAA